MRASSFPLHVLMVVTGPETSVEARIMDNIAEALGAAGIAHDVFRPCGMTDRGFLQRLAQCDIVLFHTPLLLSFFYALMARYWYRKPIVGIAWDSYPVTLGGIRYDRSVRRRIFDRIENTVVALCDRVLVPSADFLKEPRLADAKVVGLWHPVNLPTVGTGSQPNDTTAPLEILFAGQINATRGLAAAVSRLDQVTGGRFRLKVASGNPLPSELVGHPKVEHLGHLDRAALRQVAAGCDCGLVSLASDFDGPGIPSKSFEYLEAGLPCIYYGKRLDHYLQVLERSGAGIDINPDRRNEVSRDEMLRLKQDIVLATAGFMAAFGLDSSCFAAHLLAVKART